MPSSSWDLKRYVYAPALGLRGLFRLSFFKDALIMSGAGVGGGSLVYAMTLYTPPPAFFADRQWQGLADWASELAPHYETAQRMLGVTDVTEDDPADQLLRRYGRLGEAGVAWSRLATGPGPLAALGWIELAKEREHRDRDPEGAWAATDEALMALYRSRGHGSLALRRGLEADLGSRRARLARRLTRQTA